MKYSIQQIKAQENQLLILKDTFNIKQALLKRNVAILDIEPVKVDGYFSANDYEVIFHGDIDVNLILPSTRTMSPVEVHLVIPVKERYVDAAHDDVGNDYEETTIVLQDEYINLEETIIDSIILNIPTKVIGDDEDDAHLPKGNDWEVITEDNYLQRLASEKEQTIDPRLAKLQQLLEDDE